MKKFVLTDTNSEVQLGDKICFHNSIVRDGKCVEQIHEDYVLTEKTLGMLIKDGTITVKEIPDPKEETPKKCLEDYIESLAKRNRIPIDVMVEVIKLLISVNPAAVLTMLLKEIAIDLDNKYEGHIKDSEHIFIFSTNRGFIVELPKTEIKSYRNFAAFRTYKDAKYACNICKDLIDLMYPSEQQKD